MRQQGEHLSPLRLPFGDGVFDDCDADSMALATNNSYIRMAVSCYLPPVHCAESARSASTRLRVSSEDFS